MRIPLFVILLLLFIAAVLLVAGLVTGWSSWTDLASAERADGAVVELVRVKSPQAQSPKKGQAISKGPAYAPVVEYQVGGQTYRIQGHVAASPPAYSVGDRVQVLVPPERPAEGRIESFSEQWLVPAALGGGGLLFGVVGLAMAFARRGAEKTSGPFPGKVS
jgi:hypothetical protein